MHPDYVDPELKYCPECSEEYRAEITRCADCGAELVTGVAMHDRLAARQDSLGSGLQEIVPGERMTGLLKGPLLQIKQLQSSLRRQGIASLVVGGAAHGCSSAGCRGPELLLQVRTDELALAQVALEDEHRQTTGLSDHDSTFAGEIYSAHVAEATCPACGARFPTSSASCPECGLSFSCE